MVPCKSSNPSQLLQMGAEKEKAKLLLKIYYHLWQKYEERLSRPISTSQ